MPDAGIWNKITGSWYAVFKKQIKNALSTNG